MKFIREPIVALGDENNTTALGPVMARGPIAAALIATVEINGLSKAIRPLLVTEQRWPLYRVRAYYASNSGALWLSPGCYELPLVRYARLWIKAWLRLNRSEPIPQAWLRR